MSTPRMPAGFVAHGAPLLALDEHKGAPLAAWGRTLPKPRAVLWVSAHFEAAPVTLSATSSAPLVYDFYGFPEPLYRVQYPAPGAPWLAERIAGLLEGTPVRRDEGRGLDHGAWVPALHLFPDADVPMLQISLPTLDGAALLALGRRLAPLRDEGVLVLGSGNLTHNLRRLDLAERSAPPSWAREFDAWCAEALAKGDVDELVAFRERAPAVEIAHPRVEHFVPLLVAVGATGGSFSVATRVDGWEYGSLSRRSVELG